MPRQSRVSWLNYPHLVIAEANSGRSLFHDDNDYVFYLNLIRQLVRDRLLKVFAYCLLEYELRLVLEPNRLSLSRIMQRLHGKHTAYINNRYERVGHLFRGRFKSLVFNSDDILPVVRSVHLWPVRLGILRRPEFYPYASHSSYMGIKDMDFLSTNQVLSQFSGDHDAKKRGLARYVELSALEPDDLGVSEIRPGIGSETLIEKARFVAEHLRKPSLKSLAEGAGLLLSISSDQFFSLSRRQDLVMARRLLATAAVLGARRSVTEVAHFLGRDKAQVSRLVTQGMDLLDSNEAFILMFEALKTRSSVRFF
jgi:REP element-mobilizing transposase RayT